MEFYLDGNPEDTPVDSSCGDSYPHCLFLPSIKGGASRTGGQFGMATFNGFDGNRADIGDYINGFVGEQDTAFIALQEVTDAEAASLEARFSWDCISGGTDEQLCDTDPNDGIQLTGEPIVYNLPTCKGDSRNVVFSNTTDGGLSGPVVGSTHLCHEGRQQQYDALQQIVEENFDGPVIVGADTNTKPAELAAAFSLDLPQIACNEEAGKSCPGEVGERDRVDNIITFPDPSGSGQILSINLSTGVRGVKTDLSDHTPVATKVEYKIGQLQNIRQEMIDIGG